eukprot:g11227.t1
MRVHFNSGAWTEEERQGFLRGLEVYGRGNWEAIGVFVPTRSPPQIEEYARQHDAGVESVHQEEEVLSNPEQVQIARGGETHPYSSTAAPSSSSPPSLNGGGGSGGDSGGNGGYYSEPPVVAHLVDGVPATRQQQEELDTNSGIDVATGSTPSADAVPGGQGTHEQQQQQEHHEYRPGEPIGNLMAHEIPYPNPLVLEEPALGEELKRYFGVMDYCGVL